MVATKLSIYNGALTLLGERKLIALTDNRESRRILDIIWDGGAVNFCLRRGLWNFAIRTIKIDYDPDYSPTFGYRKVFTKPTDCMRVVGLSADEYFVQPLNEYKDENNRWYSDVDSLYVSYVSNGETFGGDYSTWPELFTRYVESYLAAEICERLTQNTSKKQELVMIMKELLRDAKSVDAQDEAAAFPPRGSWSRSRFGSRNSTERRGD